MQEKEVRLSDNDTRVSLFLSEMDIKKWDQYGLPLNDFYILNGLLLTISSRWPLIIDPEQQATNWIKNLEDDVRLLDANSIDLVKNLCQCVEKGIITIMYNVETTIDSNLDKVSFMLHTYETKRDYLKFDINTDPKVLLNHGFNVDKMTKFVAHGWVATGLEFVPPFAEGLYHWRNLDIHIKRCFAEKVPL